MKTKKKKLSARQIAHNYDVLAKELNKCSEECEAAKRDERNALQSRDVARGKVSELKKLLIDAEKGIADLEGYLRRVKEDDTVRESLIDLPSDNGPDPYHRPSRLPVRAFAFPHGGEGRIFAAPFDRDEKKDWRDY